MRRLGLVALLATASCRGDARAPIDGARSDADAEAAEAPTDGSGVEAGARPRVVIVAGGPSHGPGEHEYRAGALLLRRLLDEVGVQVDVVTDGWPADIAIFTGARAVGFFSDGEGLHPLVQGTRLPMFTGALGPGTGFFCLHYGVHYPQARVPEVLPLLGGAYVTGISTNPHWTARFDAFPQHPTTRGLSPFSLLDEWYFNIVFAEDRPPVALLQATPPDNVRGTPAAASHPGRRETLAWAYTRPDGGRAFGYTGLHFHSSWSVAPVRRLVVNAVLWAAGLEVPAGGAPVTLDPAWLAENLDPK